MRLSLQKKRMGTKGHHMSSMVGETWLIRAVENKKSDWFQGIILTCFIGRITTQYGNPVMNQYTLR